MIQNEWLVWKISEYLGILFGSNIAIYFMMLRRLIKIATTYDVLKKLFKKIGENKSLLSNNVPAKKLPEIRRLNRQVKTF